MCIKVFDNVINSIITCTTNDRTTKVVEKESIATTANNQSTKADEGEVLKSLQPLPSYSRHRKQCYQVQASQLANCSAY